VLFGEWVGKPAPGTENVDLSAGTKTLRAAE